MKPEGISVPVNAVLRSDTGAGDEKTAGDDTAAGWSRQQIYDLEDKELTHEGIVRAALKSMTLTLTWVGSSNPDPINPPPVTPPGKVVPMMFANFAYTVEPRGWYPTEPNSIGVVWYPEFNPGLGGVMIADGDFKGDFCPGGIIHYGEVEYVGKVKPVGGLPLRPQPPFHVKVYVTSWKECGK
jgi:hypothetical protein